MPKVVEVAKIVAPSGANTLVDGWNALVSGATACKATTARKMTARAFIVDDVMREQEKDQRRRFEKLAVF